MLKPHEWEVGLYAHTGIKHGGADVVVQVVAVDDGLVEASNLITGRPCFFRTHLSVAKSSTWVMLPELPREDSHGTA